jgi:hypothetical protein
MTLTIISGIILILFCAYAFYNTTKIYKLVGDQKSLINKQQNVINDLANTLRDYKPIMEFLGKKLKLEHEESLKIRREKDQKRRLNG